MSDADRMPEDMTQATFATHLGQTFQVRLPDEAGVLDMELIKAESLPDRGGGRADPFVLEFRGPLDRTLAQGIWRFEHESLDPLDIFVVPVGPDETGLCYEAIFN